MYWSKKTRPDMKLAADWKAMNRDRVIDNVDRETGRVTSEAFARVKPAALHALAMGVRP